MDKKNINNDNINTRYIVDKLETFYSGECLKEKKVEWINFDYEQDDDTLEINFKWVDSDESQSETWDDFSENLDIEKGIYPKPKPFKPLTRSEYYDLVLSGEEPCGSMTCNCCGNLICPSVRNGTIYCPNCTANLKGHLEDMVEADCNLID